MPRRAVAIDLGASSARFALGEIASEPLPYPRNENEGGVGEGVEPNPITFQVIEQVPHSPREWNGHEVWDIDFLLEFCRKALKFAKDNGAESIGIDTWGVDHGFIGNDGNLIQPPICYRDHSHVAMFEKMKEHRPWLYAQTGIQHQPFNTIYQLLARKEEQPELFAPTPALPRRPADGGGSANRSLPHERSHGGGLGWGNGPQWLLLPDLLLYLLGGEPGYERSIATTTQLTNSKGDWNQTVFDRFGLPIPSIPISDPGIAGEIDGIRLARVGGHDTACAVEGMGLKYVPDTNVIFVNLGTWVLVGKVNDRPDHTTWAEDSNLTNERTPWNDVRLLTNIPGFFILNRLHKDLKLTYSVGEWLEGADMSRSERINVFDSELYAPESMLCAVSEQLKRSDLSAKEWAGIGLLSLVDVIVERARLLNGTEIRLAGGGSRSNVLQRALEESSKMIVKTAPVEATILGNLSVQFQVLGEQ